MQLFIRNRSVVFRNGINRKPLRGSFGWCIPFSPSSRLRRQLGATRPPPYGVHDGTKKAREDQDFWRTMRAYVPEWDKMIADFNDKVAK